MYLAYYVVLNIKQKFSAHFYLIMINWLVLFVDRANKKQ